MGVPTHRVEIRKHKGSHSWANDYLVESPSMDDAETCANLFIDFERLLHYDNVVFDNARISTMSVGDRVFRHIVINAAGLAASSGIQFLPLFNTLRLDMETNDSDPCRKYYRIPIPESQQDDGVLSSAILTGIGPAFVAVLAAMPDGSSIVSNIGHIVINGGPFAQVQMRQLHRHKKKKVIV